MHLSLIECTNSIVPVSSMLLTHELRQDGYYYVHENVYEEMNSYAASFECSAGDGDGHGDGDGDAEHE